MIAPIRELKFRGNSPTKLAMRVFLAGASGAIGRRLVPLLKAAGASVVGTTRAPEKAAALRASGVEAIVVDMFDADAVHRAVQQARPDFVIHQLTDLPASTHPEALAAARPRNARLRAVATPILMQAARAAGVRRAVVQSICFVYAGGNPPHRESDPVTAAGVVELETAALNTLPVEGLVLRYGRLWGPGTWAADAAGLTAPLHVDAAAHAALRALTRGDAGVYNVAEGDGYADVTKAVRELGFDPSFRLPVEP
jgi:nucleoside-diphosphate-sugar epimerase